jgi:hypothetical protein
MKRAGDPFIRSLPNKKEKPIRRRRGFSGPFFASMAFTLRHKNLSNFLTFTFLYDLMLWFYGQISENCDKSDNIRDKNNKGGG